MSERRTVLNLTELEQRAIDSPINLSDGHPRQDPTGSQAKLICRLPEFFEIAAAEPFAEIERRAQAAFLGTLGQARAPLDGGRVFSVYSSSVATMAVANVLSGHRVALIHPTFDNIHDILVRQATMIPISEDACVEGDLSQALAGNATCVFVTTPNNPTGRALDEADLRRLADDCAANGLLLCLDVSFRGFDLRAQFDHYAVLEDSGVDYVVIEDTGKLWPMQELKLGFVAVSESMRAKVEHALSDVLLTVSPFVLTLIEMLAVDAAQGGLAELHRLITENRRIVSDAVGGLDRVELLDPQSRISVGRLRFSSPTDADRTRRGLYERGVHVLPCRQFHWADQQEGAALLRVALARNGATLAEGMRRLAAAHASLAA
ncbi:aminotransferase class I/II-fold pyridoxal phosphate-dependent enzyme [Rhizomonospora bruguierae]|uniref:aminotransferase class I/II-fold pyridoxal phosphate-dependent enzyme n=1 Tax=Rhizomonospora bruguierae TaxID=1581705 RepID=UPI001BD16E40|nr:aminotransferase class I/II-fold pyridoxal phosphate-dependent enzyme [Micromonospora sp. NBRC 107566]